MTFPRQNSDGDPPALGPDHHPVLAVIPARGGSKGLPDKNLRLLGGLPLIGHALRCAQLAPQVARTIVSTDSDAIANAARALGGDVPFLRPAELARDDSPTMGVLQHALRFVEAQEGRRYGLVLLLEPTSPGRLPADIAETDRLLAANPHADGVVAVSEPHFNPFYVGVVERDGLLVPAVPRPAGLTRRQDAPRFLRINGAVYLWRRDFLLATGPDWTTGRHVPLIIPESRAVSIDDLTDMLIAEAMLEKGVWQLPWLTGGIAVTPIRIADHLVGGPRCFVIAEAGVNHNGDPDLARRLVDIAADAGADAIKFQTFDPAALVTADAPKAAYQQRNDGTSRSQRQMLDALVLPHALHHELRARAHDRGLLFLSTPFDEGSADFLVDLGVPALKVGSGELTNHLLLRHLARKGLPLLLSTGMAVLDEIAAALTVIRGAGDPPVALFHCVSNYPCAPAEANLRAMATLRDRFGLPCGWSDHTLGIDIALASIALGAQLLEKHFTVDRRLPGPDHLASLEPAELGALVRGVRAVESALGTGAKLPSPAERAVALVARRSLYWRRALPAGQIVREEDLQALRPCDGLSADRIGDLIGHRLQRAVTAGARISADDVTDPGGPA